MFFFHNINCIPWGRHRPGSVKPTKKMRQQVTLWVQRKKNHIFSRHANFAPPFFRILGWNELPALCTCHARELLSAGEEWDVLLRSLGWVVGWLGSSGGKWWWETARHPWVTLLFELTYPFPSRHFWVHDFRTFPFGVRWAPQDPDGFRFNRH